MADATYDATRDAWRDIWTHTDIERELAAREYARSRQIRDRFVPHLPIGVPILEAGCGLGAELLGLAAGPYTVVGLDYVTSAVQRLKVYRRDLRMTAGDIHALPFRDESFGAYLSFGVLEHFTFGPEPALREAFRVLRPGGILVLTVPAPNVVWRLARVKRRLQPNRHTSGPRYYETTYSADVLSQLVTNAGFDILERHPVGHAFTLWGCGRMFRGPGYYETTTLAERLGALLARVLPWSTSFATLIIARTPGRTRTAP